MVDVISKINSTKSEIQKDISGLNAARLATREGQAKAKMDDLHTSLSAVNNFLDYSENNLDLIRELDRVLSGFTHASTIAGFNASVTNARASISSLLAHIEKVNDAHKNIVEEAKIETVEIGSDKQIDLSKHFDLSLVPVVDLDILSPGLATKSVKLKNKDGRDISNRNWSVGAGNILNFVGNRLKVDLSVAGAIPAGINKNQYPLSVEIDLFSRNGVNAKIKTLPKIKINIKEPVNSVAVLGSTFTGTESYREALDTRLDNYYNTNSEKVIKDYILDRINNAGGTLSDTQKDILVDHMYNDPSFLNGNSALAYTAANLKTDIPNQVKDDSVGGDVGYKDALRNLLINPTQFDQKSKEVISAKLKDKRKNAGFLINDDKINQQVNELIQEQASNSIGNIINGSLPALFGNFGNKNNRVIRHKNKHKTGFRGFKKMLGVFKPKTRRKLTDISTNNYFSFMSGASYNISDEANVAGKKVNQNIKLDMNSRNNVSASIKVTGDETADFEFAGASSIYELITGVLSHNQVGAVTKIYLVFNIYKQFLQKMQSLFGEQDIKIGSDIYSIKSKDKLTITKNGDNIFSEDQFRNLESSTDLQSSMTNLAGSFNLIMGAQNKSYIDGMTTKKRNKFKIGGERVGRILRKRRNADFAFKTEVEGVSISYEDKKFTVIYEGEEIKANKLETILSHKILEGKQIQIMKAVYKEMINTNATDPKAQKLLEKKSGIGFVIKHNSQEYVVSTQGDKLRFGLIPAGFPRANIDKKTGILKGGMFVSINEDEVLSNPELSSQLIRGLRRYRRKWVRGVDYGV